MGTKRNGWKWFPRAVPMVLAATGLMVALAGSAGATGRYADKAGDNGAAPDLAGAEVSSDAFGLITFRIDVPNMPPAGSYELFIDSDANSATGNTAAGGVDYVFLVVSEEHGYDFGRWNGSTWDFNTSPSTVRASAGPSGFLISVNRSELGNAGRLNFRVVSLASQGGTGNSDAAPDKGLWNYDLAAGGPNIDTVIVQTTPVAGPRVGKAFAINVSGIVLPQTNGPDVLQPDSWKCTATLAGRPLSGTGTGRCSFRIPKKKSKGKQLLVTVSVTYQGATKSLQLPFKVRQ